MPDTLPNQAVLHLGGWLQDEPATWHEMNRALQDVTILLQYLGELPDARLLGAFRDAQAKLADNTILSSVPPCKDYGDFLRQILQIAGAFQTGRTDLLPPYTASARPFESHEAIAFVFWSRDFLSAVAAPATAESIRLTHDYLVSRAWSFTRAKVPPQAAQSKIPALPPDLGAPTRTRLAAKLASRVQRYELLTLFFVFVTVLVSIYALSGRLILSREQLMHDAWIKVDAALEAEENKVFPAATIPITGEARERMSVTGLCDLTRTSAPADSPQVPSQTFYAMPHQAHLCADRAKALLNLFVATVHLQSWSSVITDYISALGWPFGVVSTTLHIFSQQDPACFGLRPPEHDVSRAKIPCEDVLRAEIDRSRHVADSILGALTQYVLPVLYGYLGAMAAAMRLLRRKIDAALLSYTDRARLHQGAILGILCGAVIGLFATFMHDMGSTGSVGTAALALLAGYNVDGVFRFLDELSDRLFRPAMPTKPA